MDKRIERLITAFETKGWKLEGSVEEASDWWYCDILQLSSVWRPLDTKIFLTLLLDPQFLDEKIVWCIGISKNIPDNPNSVFIERISLNEINRTNLLSLIDNINKLVLNVDFA